LFYLSWTPASGSSDFQVFELNTTAIQFLKRLKNLNKVRSFWVSLKGMAWLGGLPAQTPFSLSG